MVSNVSTFASNVSVPYYSGSSDNGFTRFIDKQIWTRFKHLVWIPKVTIAHALDGINACLWGSVSILTFGTTNNVNQHAVEFFKSTAKIAPDLFAGVIKVINPDAKIERHHDSGAFYEFFEKIFRVSDALASNRNNWIERNVFARIGFAASAVVAVVTRVVDAVIGVFGLIGALCAFGNSQYCNDIAYAGLHITALPGDLYECLVKVINPQASFYS